MGVHRRRPAVSAAIFVSLLVASSGNAQLQQSPVEQLEGTLLIVWGDPHPDVGVGGEVRYGLALQDGRVFPLRLAGHESAAASHFGKRVVVSGSRVARSPTTADTAPEVIQVQTIARIDTGLDDASVQAVLGTRRVIYLLAKFSDDADVPHPPQFYLDMTNPDAPPVGAPFPTTLNGFFKKTSWDQFSWLADVGGVGGVGASGGWLTLSQPKNYYAPCGSLGVCANLTALADDAMALGRAQGIDFKVYDNINFVLSNDLDCCTWGGSHFSSVDNKSYGATWSPPPSQNALTYAHELGHSLGLVHSGYVYYAGDSPWDVMAAGRSINRVPCGSYRSINNSGAVRTFTCGEPANGYIAPHKDQLGWIPPANLVTTDTQTGGTWTIDGDALPLGAPIKMIKVCLPGLCGNPDAPYITVEARVKGLGATSQYDNDIPGEGVIIHDVVVGRAPVSGPCFASSQSGWAAPVDATPGDYNSTDCTFSPGTALFNAQWTPGQTYTDNQFGVSIAVLSRAGSSFSISVTPAPATVPPGAFSKSTPPNGTTGLPNHNRLGWGTSRAATRYEYCIDTTNDNACSGWTNAGRATDILIHDLPGATYYWQVRSVGPGGTTYANGSAASFWSFTTASPGSFSKLTPTNGATGQPLSVTLSWSPSAGATSYHYCYTTINAGDGVCRGPLYTVVNTSANVILSPNTTYYWQLWAFNAQGFVTYANGSFGALWSFSTGNPPPTTFNKISPADGSAGQSRNPILRWDASLGATDYEVCADTTNDGACSGWRTTARRTDTNLAGLAPGTTYYWHVRATSGGGTTYADGSSIAYWSFRTREPFTDEPLTPGTRVRAIHITELRARIDELRAAHGLPAYNWADPTLVAGSSAVRAQHILDLRTALSQAWTASGRTPPLTFADPDLGAGTTIRQFHIVQLRLFVVTLE
jgi:M6 family metalloprotease-like protein